MKRFTDTSKWKDAWFQDLPTKYKLFWIYLLDECDNAGVWKPNVRLAAFQIGEPFEEIELKRIFAGRIEILESGYWHVKKFIEFQYGELSEQCKPHIQILRLIQNHKIKGYTKGIHTLKDKEKEKDKDKEEVKEKEKTREYFFEVLKDQIWLESVERTHRGKDVQKAAEEAHSWLISDQARYSRSDQSDFKKLIVTWLSNQKGEKPERKKRDISNL